MQNSTIDTCYKLAWYSACSELGGGRCGELVAELFDFCRVLFENFFYSRKSSFRNKKYTAQVFNYTALRDNDSGFNIKKFIMFLKKSMNDTMTKIDSLNNFRLEIINLLEHVLYIKSQSTTKNLVITFTEWKEYKHIFKYVAMQYEYTCGSDNEYTLYASESRCKTLDFNISLK